MPEIQSLGIKLNNPGNIRYNEHNRFKGLEGSEKGFCKFVDIEHGIRAVMVVLRNYMRRGIVTPRQIITRYAPPSENPTNAYIDYLCKNVSSNLGLPIPLDKDEPIYWQSSLFLVFVKYMLKYESGLDASDDLIMRSYKIMD